MVKPLIVRIIGLLESLLCANHFTAVLIINPFSHRMGLLQSTQLVE